MKIKKNGYWLNSGVRDDKMISVCLASYNGEKYISEQIDSILVQLGTQDELIISDDGSTDKTIKILNEYKEKDKRVSILYNNSRCYTRNFENAISHAKGDYVFLSDQDDIWKNDKVNITMDMFNKTDADLLVSDASIVDGEKNVIMKSCFEMSATRVGFLNNWISTSYIGACMAFKRKILERVLPIPGDDKYIAHDYWIACVCELYYKTDLINQPLILYRRHGENTSPAFGKSNLSIFDRIYKRFYTLFFLFMRRNG